MSRDIRPGIQVMFWFLRPFRVGYLRKYSRKVALRDCLHHYYRAPEHPQTTIEEARWESGLTAQLVAKTRWKKQSQPLDFASASCSLEE